MRRRLPLLDLDRAEIPRRFSVRISLIALKSRLRKAQSSSKLADRTIFSSLIGIIR
jgi:hypothetical protein